MLFISALRLSHRQRSSLFSFLVATVLLSLVFSGCARTTPQPTGEEGLIWEAWTVIKDSYVDGSSVDSENVSESVITALMEQAEEPAYPFLTELGLAKGRPPRGVPGELVNVWKAWETLHQRHPQLDDRALAIAGVRGMVKGLDDRATEYLTPEAYDRASEEAATNYEGIGAFVNTVDGAVVLSPMRGGPADRAGVRAGDVLLEVDGDSVLDLTADEAVERVRGLARTKVTLTVGRPDEERPLEFTITRGTIDVPTVDVQLLPGAIGYIYVSEFKETTPGEVLDVVERLKAADMLALILDLRLNSGGPVDSARKVAGEFLPAGLFMYEVDSKGDRTDWLVEGEGIIASGAVPMAVLVNEFTADSSEALAGALQDAGRAKVIGTSTQGKGSAHSYFELADGSAIQLAVSRWRTPMDRPISGEGIVPDIYVPWSTGGSTRDAQLAEAYNYLDELLPLFR